VNPTNFGELIWRAARLFPDRPALLQDDVTVTYAHLEERVRRATAHLRSLGVRRAEPVLLLLPNDWRFPEALLGAIRAGAVGTPLNVRLGADTLRYIAAHSEGRILLAHSALRELAEALAVEHTVYLDEPGWPGTRSDGEAEPVDRGEPAMLMYTSGSTGRPKGVLLAHRSKWWQARSSAACYMLTEDDRALVTGPLYHANALWACLLPMLLVGGSAAIMPSWTAETMLAAVDRHRPTYTSGTPAMFTLVLKAWEDAPDLDLSSLRLVVCGSAPVPQELLDALHRRLGDVDVLESYGLTEGGANVLTPRWGVHKLARLVSRYPASSSGSSPWRIPSTSAKRATSASSGRARPRTSSATSSSPR
jgi:acyl-CoA synthetase (AMP-forming)/AMP-acid ligase II